MENQQLNVKLLETAIGAMQRNRALLFAINLMAALVIVLVYLERFSIDKAQMEAHLLAHRGRCKEIRVVMEKTPGWASLSQDDQGQFKDCSDPDRMSRLILANAPEDEPLRAMSKSLFKLRRNRNDMNSTRLGTADVTPLGLGLQVPRNDMYIILGVLLVTLYTWLAFSFNQHARITTKIKRMYPEPDLASSGERATVSDLIELNFLFRTSHDRKTRLVVKTLYWLAPISMTLASINNSLPDTSDDFRAYFNSLVRIPLMAQWGLTIVLWAIGYSVNRSDNVANIDSTETVVDPSPTQDSSRGKDAAVNSN